MGIFGRKHRIAADVIDDWLRTDAVRWEPVPSAIMRPLRGPAANMGDDGQVGLAAYETVFTSPDVAGAGIAICTYVCATSEAFWNGVRFTYSTETAPGWSYTGYESDPYDFAHGSYAEADRAAAELARMMGLARRWAAVTMPGIFDWDGQQFDTAIPAAGEES